MFSEKPDTVTALRDRVLHRLPMLLLVLGIVSIGLIAAVDLIDRNMREAFQYNDIVHEMQIELSKAHLALEEDLRGIEGQDIALVWQGIDRTEAMIVSALNGGKTLHGHTVKPLPHNNLRADMEDLRVLVVRFRELARNVSENKTLLPAINSMDSVYHQFLKKSFILDEQLEEIQDADEKRSRKLILLLLISWSGIISAAVAGLWYRERLAGRMQAAILNAKHQWEHTFDVIPDLIAVIDKDHRIVRANKAMVEKMGIEIKDILGRKCYELFHQSSGPIEACPHAHLLHDNQGHAAEIYEKQFDAYYLVTVSPLFNDQGGLIGSVHVARDISTQKKDAAELKQYSLDLGERIKELRCLYAISEVVRKPDIHLDEILRESADLLTKAYMFPEITVCRITWDDQEYSTPNFIRTAWSQDRIILINNRQVGRIEVCYREERPRQDEGPFLAEERKLLNAVADLLGRAAERMLAEKDLDVYQTQLESLVRERTNELAQTNDKLRMEVLGHEQTADALERSESSFRQLSQEFNILLDAIPDSLVLLSPDLKVKWANKSAHQTLMPEEYRGSDYCYTLWHRQDRPCDDCPVLKSFRSGDAENVQLTTPDNRIWAVRAYPIKNESGEVESVMELGTDITEKRTLQAEQMRSNHLASIGELAAGVAHEINNPINGIINYAQIIVNSAAPESREYDIATRIIKEGGRISFIVTSLLSFARERKEEKRPVLVRHVLSDALALTETVLKKSGITLKADIDPNIPLIKVHAQQIQQVFLNIINNARYALEQKYPQADPDKVLLITATETVVNEEPFVQIVLEDHGTGIPEPNINKVMNPFYTTKPVGIGTGLGLSISHGIILDHNGRLSVESEEGAYTRIIVSLPAYREAGL